MLRGCVWIIMLIAALFFARPAYSQAVASANKPVAGGGSSVVIGWPVYDRSDVEIFKAELAAASSFDALRTLRNKLASTIDSLKDELAGAERRVYGLPDTVILRGLLGTAEQRLKDAKVEEEKCRSDPQCGQPNFAAPAFGVPTFNDSISFLSGEVDRISRDLELVEGVGRQVPMAQGKISDLEQIFDQLDRKINDFLARDIVAQSFKSEVSLYFTAIVGLMILSFFGLLFFDPSIRATIFSSPSAIQFITLFSLVIAIILFGITGILESKELSALLGGLSGYILGRYSNEASPKGG